MKIFIADYLPLKNKGEEEIIRGIESLFRKKTGDAISFSIFDEVDSVVETDNIMAYPRSWVYPDFSQRRGSSKLGEIRSIIRSLKFYLGIDSLASKIKAHEALFTDLKTADLVLIGHDGFYNQYSAAMSFFLHDEGIQYSILGAGFARPNKKIRFVIDLLNKKCFNNARYVVLRENTAFEYVREISSNPRVYLFPDPAFFCESEGVESKESKDIVSNQLSIDKLKIGITVCENSISFSGAFQNSENKVEAHRVFMSRLIQGITNKLGCEFFFIPHCIEQGAGDDLAIAYDICKRLGDDSKIHVIDVDLPVLELKNIISHLDYLVGERTHSIINCISSQVPFTSLTCSRDFRTHDIVEVGCKLSSCIIDLDAPFFDDVESRILEGIINRETLKSDLRRVNKDLSDQLNRILEII